MRAGAPTAPGPPKGAASWNSPQRVRRLGRAYGPTKATLKQVGSTTFNDHFQVLKESDTMSAAKAAWAPVLPSSRTLARGRGPRKDPSAYSKVNAVARRVTRAHGAAPVPDPMMGPVTAVVAVEVAT